MALSLVILSFPPPVHPLSIMFTYSLGLIAASFFSLTQGQTSFRVDVGINGNLDYEPPFIGTANVGDIVSFILCVAQLFMAIRAQ